MQWTDQLRKHLQTARLLTEEYRGDPFPMYMPYMPPSTVQVLDYEQNHLNLPSVMAYSPVTS